MLQQVIHCQTLVNVFASPYEIVIGGQLQPIF
jgi:hypothetical protein